MVAYAKLVETLVVDDAQCPHSKVSEEVEQVRAVGDRAR